MKTISLRVAAAGRVAGLGAVLVTSALAVGAALAADAADAPPKRADDAAADEQFENGDRQEDRILPAHEGGEARQGPNGERPADRRYAPAVRAVLEEQRTYPGPIFPVGDRQRQPGQGTVRL